MKVYIGKYPLINCILGALLVPLILLCFLRYLCEWVIIFCDCGTKLINDIAKKHAKPLKKIGN